MVLWDYTEHESFLVVLDGLKQISAHENVSEM